MKKTDIIYGIHASVSALNNKKRDISGWKCTKEVFEKIKKKIDKEIISKSKIVDRKNGGGSRIRTYVHLRGQIYSLMPLNTRPSLRERMYTLQF